MKEYKHPDPTWVVRGGGKGGMNKVKAMTLLKDLELSEHKIVKGDKVDAKKIGDVYKVFHHSGWWVVDKEYFEGEEYI